MRFMHHVSWPATLFVPALLALAVVVVGVFSPGVPRYYFIVAFLFFLVVLPGILVTLKVLATPVTAAEITLVGTRKGQNVDVMFPDGSVGTFQNAQLYNGLLTGEFKQGDRFRVLIRGDIMFRWQRLDGESGT